MLLSFTASGSAQHEGIEAFSSLKGNRDYHSPVQDFATLGAAGMDPDFLLLLKPDSFRILKRFFRVWVCYLFISSMQNRQQGVLRLGINVTGLERDPDFSFLGQD